VPAKEIYISVQINETAQATYLTLASSWSNRIKAINLPLNVRVTFTWGKSCYCMLEWL